MKSSITPILEALTTECSTLDAFIAVLNREQAALIDSNLDALIGMTKQKNEYARQLERLAQQRLHLFAQNQISIEAIAPYALICDAPTDECNELQQVWQRLLQQARQASMINQSNGRLIDIRQRQNQQILGLLQDSLQMLCYNAYGQPDCLPLGSSLGKA